MADQHAATEGMYYLATLSVQHSRFYGTGVALSKTSYICLRPGAHLGSMLQRLHHVRGIQALRRTIAPAKGGSRDSNALCPKQYIYIYCFFMLFSAGILDLMGLGRSTYSSVPTMKSTCQLQDPHAHSIYIYNYISCGIALEFKHANPLLQVLHAVTAADVPPT